MEKFVFDFFLNQLYFILTINIEIYISSDNKKSPKIGDFYDAALQRIIQNTCTGGHFVPQSGC